MTGECGSCKHPFDITKSKRTRRPSNLAIEDDKVTPATFADCDVEVKVAPAEIDAEDKAVSEEAAQVDAEETTGRAKLKQYIKVDGESQDVDEKRAVLGQHFADEKRLQMVIKQQREGGSKDLRFKRMVKRYVKALSHLVKSKNSQRLDKPVLRLTM